MLYAALPGYLSVGYLPQPRTAIVRSVLPFEPYGVRAIVLGMMSVV
jgi:hypothetical protein